MKKVIQSTVIAIIAMFSINSAIAQNMHWVEAPTKTDNGTTLTVCGKIAGLGNNKGITITIVTTATITTQCTNPAGKIAPGQTRTETISRTATFQSDKNGHVSFCLNTLEQMAGTCPNGQWTGKVMDVSFVNTTVSVDGKMLN